MGLIHIPSQKYRVLRSLFSPSPQVNDWQKSTLMAPYGWPFYDQMCDGDTLLFNDNYWIHYYKILFLFYNTGRVWWAHHTRSASGSPISDDRRWQSWGCLQSLAISEAGVLTPLTLTVRYAMRESLPSVGPAWLRRRGCLSLPRARGCSLM